MLVVHMAWILSPANGHSRVFSPLEDSPTAVWAYQVFAAFSDMRYNTLAILPSRYRRHELTMHAEARAETSLVFSSCEPVQNTPKICLFFFLFFSARSPHLFSALQTGWLACNRARFSRALFVCWLHSLLALVRSGFQTCWLTNTMKKIKVHLHVVCSTVFFVFLARLRRFRLLFGKHVKLKPHHRVPNFRSRKDGALEQAKLNRFQRVLVPSIYPPRRPPPRNRFEGAANGDKI